MSRFGQFFRKQMPNFTTQLVNVNNINTAATSLGTVVNTNGVYQLNLSCRKSNINTSIIEIYIYSGSYRQLIGRIAADEELVTASLIFKPNMNCSNIEVVGGVLESFALSEINNIITTAILGKYPEVESIKHFIIKNGSAGMTFIVNNSTIRLPGNMDYESYGPVDLNIEFLGFIENDKDNPKQFFIDFNY